MKKEIKENWEKEFELYGEWEYWFSKLIEKGIDWQTQTITHIWRKELEKRILKERQKVKDEILKKMPKEECIYDHHNKLDLECPRCCEIMTKNQALQEIKEIIENY